MTNPGARTRTDSASRIVQASPQAIYRAFVDPKSLASWLPPRGMTGEILAFEPRVSGRYRMVLTYEASQHSGAGKTSENTDIVQGRFLELIPDERIVQSVEFVSEDPSFAGTMTMSWSLAPVGSGTEVTILCENVPAGIRQEDHDVGLRSTLANLAAFLE
ncbi:SRPBCC family protein [Bosea sp. 2YAB26]|uniref:SRPBCC family protein n=1 Tax=Bosea sp. 2YAB26 TaxID=3237478 RepID=UPI003F8E236E